MNPLLEQVLRAYRAHISCYDISSGELSFLEGCLAAYLMISNQTGPDAPVELSNDEVCGLVLFAWYCPLRPQGAADEPFRGFNHPSGLAERLLTRRFLGNGLLEAVR